MDTLAQLVTALGPVGILAWYLWYTTSVTLPKRDDTYTKSVEKITDGFNSSLKEEREFRRMETEALKAFITSRQYCNYNSDNPRGD